MRMGHDVDDCDLYAERFDPVLTCTEHLLYRDSPANQQAVKDQVQRLLRCEGVVFVFPTWYYGMPAILKGYFDRVWLPGVAFEMVAGRTMSMLNHIRCFGVVTTYGSPRWLNTLVLGDPNKKVFMCGMRRLVSRTARTLWLARYGMDSIGNAERERFLKTVSRKLERFG
jgi:putative NADPH-quinone reductase